LRRNPPRERDDGIVFSHEIVAKEGQISHTDTLRDARAKKRDAAPLIQTVISGAALKQISEFVYAVN